MISIHERKKIDGWFLNIFYQRKLILDCVIRFIISSCLDEKF